MNNKRVWRIVLLVAFVCMSLIISSCQKKEKTVRYDSGAYSSSVFEIPARENYTARIYSVLSDSENTIVSVVYSSFDNDGYLLDQVTDIFTIDDCGNRKYTLELLGSQSPKAVMNNEYVFLGCKNEEIDLQNGNSTNLQRYVVFIDKSTGECTRIIEPDFQPNYISTIKDGFVLVGSSSIARYTNEGRQVSKNTIDFSLYEDQEGFFEDNGKYYIIEEKDLGEIIYHEVNFETGECPAITNSRNIGINGLNIQGQYFFNPDGEYKVDLVNMTVTCLADWNCIDVRPPQKQLFSQTGYYKLDDERFAITYEYSDSAEILIFHYDSSIDYSNVKRIKIGGYGVYDDPVLRWAVYTFNTSNTDYRVVLEDYTDRFSGLLPEDRRKARLNLLRYFDEGNAPDIFYGSDFDYDYMGRNGMVIDMSGYLNSRKESLPTMTDAATKLVINENDACYQLFSGYELYGYFAKKSVVDSIPDTSIFTLYQYAQENGLVYSLTEASDIVDEALRYEFANIWGAYDGQRKVSLEELERLVSIAVSLPISQKHYASLDDVANGFAMLSPSTVYCDISSREFMDQSFQYIGYPSIHGSIRLAVPQCCLAISTTAEDSDVCWEVVSMLLSVDAQKQTLVSGYIPVTQNMIDTYCDMVMHPDSVSDVVLKGYIRNKKPIDQDTLKNFLETISQVDTVATYDWGVFDIIYDEINSYYSQTRSPEQIADTLEKRLTLYMQENYP